MSAADFVLIGIAALAAGTTVYLVIQSVRADRNVAASPQEQAHQSSTEGQGADQGAATAQVHGLPAPGAARTSLADRAPSTRVDGRADNDSQLRPLALVLPLVQAGVQPGSRGQARCSCNEREEGADREDDQGLAALVVAEFALDKARVLLEQADVSVRGSDSLRDLDDLATSWLMLANTSRELAELRRGF